MVRVVRQVTCPDCVRAEDLRAAIQYTRWPTRFEEELFADDDEYWLRIFALVAAATLSHYDEPYGMAPVILEDPSDTS